MLAIIVPTLNRADMLAPLVANIHDVTEASHTIYLVMESDDTESIEAAKSLDTIDVLGHFGSCSTAVNAGYWASTEPFVAVVNDDCIFHSGWDLAALKYFNGQVHIVGMNDGLGDCKCFPMIRRAFIEEHSGVYDRPNAVFHEYRSQGPDTEFAFYAMLRGVWADAPDAIVEHRNWRNGAADPDHPNYVKARETINDDLAEYNRRWPHWDPGRVMPPAVPTVTPY
jgi:glycosyltransferase involved in cell wall biosynthesis